jgi:hypothetical protein
MELCSVSVSEAGDFARAELRRRVSSPAGMTERLDSERERDRRFLPAAEDHGLTQNNLSLESGLVDDRSMNFR